MSSAWRQLFTRNMLICVVTGFSSGMPLFLLFNLVPAWLKTEGLTLRTIGAFALIQFPYLWKFLWSPLLDRYVLPGLGRRRGWMLMSQIGLFSAIVLAGQYSPKEDLTLVAVICAVIAFLSATQDVVLDAYRRELLHDRELDMGNGVHVGAYRVASLVPGSLSLYLSDHMSWPTVFFITALFMLPGMALALFASEPHRTEPPRTLRDAIIEPFHEFITRRGWESAMLVLAFIFLYKLGDSMCTTLATPFYMDMGYTRTEIALVAKHAGLWPAVIGGILGGVIMARTGVNRALWLFGVVQVLSIFGFAWLSTTAHHTADNASDYFSLAAVIGTEALGVGLGTAALVAYIARNTHPMYTATQFALFTSLSAAPRTLFNATTGVIVESVGWLYFFLICALLAVPGMLLLIKVAPWNQNPEKISDSPEVP